MNINLAKVLDEIEKEKGISKDILIEAIDSAIASAYKKNFASNVNDIKINISKESGEVKIFTRKTIVQKVLNPMNEISIDDLPISEKENYNIKDTILIETTPKEFGRIAAQTAKQVIVQKLREAERNVIYEKYIDKERDIVTGVVQRVEFGNIIIDLGRAEALLLPNEQMKNEEYYKGKRIKIYILEVRKTSKGPKIFASRSHPELLKRLFEFEVPEIHEGVVEIKNIAREAGKRSKVAVYSKDERVDPIGACIGDRGSRIKSIMLELKDEKIDVIRWSDDEKILIANSLSPAKVTLVNLFEKEKTATVVVPDQQLSLAIGKEGQNARLAAKLTGWKVDIKSESEYKEKNSPDSKNNLKKNDLVK
ncbi:MAG: transcription termination/antitermination protein NusA [Candidatus Atribacteria bacterium]|nr:transcription termination/antitermination protein NusA [Candidatus Atribacteria bacterium]